MTVTSTALSHQLEAWSWRLLLPLTLSIATPVLAQISPDVTWRTLRTEHFQVHYSPGLEDYARRAAVVAERAYSRLSVELVPPRGPLDLVIADNVDLTNGYATPFPTNRIVIYAQPPVANTSLRRYDEWSDLVITHELTHIFQLDRARGWWRVAQGIFGRSPPFMPHLYTPGWLNEGLAVYYESRLTGTGRLIGTEHAMFARAAVIDGGAPRLNELSLATSQFPGGQSAYAYGSLVFDYLSRTRGPEHIGEFIERLSRAPIPFFLTRASRRTFGISLDDAWREFQDSVRRDLRAQTIPMPGWRVLTTEGRDAIHPRWIDDSNLVFAANTGKETPGVYTVDMNGRTRRVGRRNGLEPNVPLADGSLLFAQVEFIDAYRVRSDLYISSGGRERRLTRDARLAQPDARDDGAIVAVQSSLGSTRLVRVTADGSVISALTTTAADTQWAEPRWSPDGRRIVAVRRGRDGYSEIVVLDTTGAVRANVSRSHAVEATPTWSADGKAIFFSSDRSGTPQVYVAASEHPPDGLPTPILLSNAITGISHPDLAPSATGLAAIVLDGDGYHVGVAPITPAQLATVLDPGRLDAMDEPLLRVERFDIDSSPSRRYSPWRTLVPRYWLPTVRRTDDDELSIGGYTSGEDVIGRHGYGAQMAVSLGSGHIDGGFSYRYSGLGNPVISATLAQFSDYDRIRSSTGEHLGFLRERTHVLGLSATLRRPRLRSSSSLTVGAELERGTFSTRPAELLDALTGLDDSPREYAGVIVAGGWANAQRPELSISPEDGISVSGSARRRWERGAANRTTTAVAVMRGYKSLDLGGFAHHVLAARVAGAWASDESTSEFEIGGTSGSSIEIFPGYSVGDSPRTFGVRGFPSGSSEGLRAAGAAVEYRAPLAMPGRGLGFLPFFFDKLSFAAFGEGAAAWCPRAPAASFVCPNRPERNDWLASAGAEINLDAAAPYDVPYRLRFGMAAPLTERVSTGADPLSAYFTLGFSF